MYRDADWCFFPFQILSFGAPEKLCLDDEKTRYPFGKKKRSRIIVKNLPKHVAEDHLRKEFSRKGEITDVQLKRTKDGKSRQFGFIGYRTEREAQEAIRYFNKSFFDTSKIICEIAHEVGDPNAPIPWSRHSLKKKDEKTKNGKNIAKSKNRSPGKLESEKKILIKDNDFDPELQEFLEVMQPRVKSKLWANDTLVAPVVDQNGKVREKQTAKKKESIEKSAVVPMESDEDDGSEYRSSDMQAINDEQSPARDDVISDMDYFKSRVKKNWSESDSSDSDDDMDDDSSLEERAKWLDIQEDVPNRQLNSSEIDVSGREDGTRGTEEDGASEMLDQDEKEVDRNRLFVRNLPYSTTEEELEEVFGKFGSISQVHIPIDKDTKRSKGIAYILYTLPECAARALEELDNSSFQGRLLHVMLAKQKNPSEKLETAAATSQGLKTFKQRRVEERKSSEASGNTKAWNTLFMRPDTVVENIARKYSVSKGDFLNTEADDLAVRLALGETQVIAETKKALKNAGVNVEALEDFATGKTGGIKRSNHVLVVKNLPYGSSDSELAKMFGEFGSLDKIILPPTKTLALVVFLEPAEARKAIKGLNYRRYKDAPLYLEWAPANVLSLSSTSEGNENSDVVGQHDAKRVILEQHLEGVPDVDPDPDSVESRTVFVKNLNFKTSDESLKKHFVEHMKEGTILSAKVMQHSKHGKYVSMGYGFIEFDSMETATNVCIYLKGTILDGHALILQLCHGKKDDQARKKNVDDRSSTKFLVRNVAFQATKKDLRQLFSPFGQVMESAKEGETLEELRARTAAQFCDKDNGFQNPTKLSRKRKNMDILDERQMKFERLSD
ncbi:Multiple RNA-binding domain-containing protein 1 [Morus notabilis]|uniref:Multiple RNA-binding domain-containing protein 1 n=1 Tax=Morus notabilis TaxID=981085 RepID=W9RW46_9ROSA|nr:Multiple RNA-binding domain-containing protein 1 [Morus notabilis]